MHFLAILGAFKQLFIFLFYIIKVFFTKTLLLRAIPCCIDNPHVDKNFLRIVTCLDFLKVIPWPTYLKDDFDQSSFYVGYTFSFYGHFFLYYGIYF